MNNGWFGTWSQLKHVVRTFGGDRDDDGEPVIGGVMIGLGGKSDGADVVIDDSSVYYVDGKPVNLLSAVTATSYGSKVKVIM